MNFKLKPKNIIRFSDRQVIKFADDRKIVYMKTIFNFKYLVDKSYILNKTFKKSNKSFKVYSNNDPVLAKCEFIASFPKIFAEISEKDAIESINYKIYGEVWLDDGQYDLKYSIILTDKTKIEWLT